MTDPPGCAIEEAAVDAAEAEVAQQASDLEVAEAALLAAELDLESCLS